MNKITKKIISFLLCITILLSVSPTSFASNSANDQVNLDKKSIENYKNINLDKYFPKIISTISDLEIIEKFEFSGMSVISYNVENIKNFIPGLKKIKALEQIDNVIYITYETINNETVILSFSENGMIDKAIYNENNDELVYIKGNQGYKHENFRNKSKHQMTKEQNKLIDEALSTGDIESLNAIPGIKTTEENGALIIELDENQNIVKAAATTKTNFVEPSKQFIPYTKRNVSTQSKFCTALNKNVTISVKQSMDTYRQSSADYKGFLASTALTVIGLYVGGGSITLAAKVVAAASVAVSGSQTILEAVTIYKSASYSYVGAKEGYAYDTTLYNKDVKVYFNSNKGVLNGGNNSSGVFTWIDYTPSSALSASTTTIIDKTIFNYNADITVNKFCSMYYPD